MNTKTPFTQTLINFLLLPLGLSLCWFCWRIAIIRPMLKDDQGSPFDLLKAFAILYWSSIIVAIIWIVYMSISLKNFRNNLLYFRVNLGILLICACIITAISIYILRPF